MGDDQAAMRTLVMQAALSHAGQALAAWNHALTLAPIDDWANELARPLPLVYLNLRRHGAFTHEQLLKGIYRAAWATNMVRLRSAVDVLQDLDENSVPYRLIKGGAVCALIGDWGARRMGDLDIAFASEHQERVADVLGRRGFSPRIASGSIDGLWENGQSGRLDVHGVDMRDAHRRWVLTDPGQRIELLTHQIHVPSREVTIAVAIQHALTGLADSDYLQGQLDVARLFPGAQDSTLVELLGSVRDQDRLADFLNELSDLGVAIDAPALLGTIRGVHRKMSAQARRSDRRRARRRMLLVVRKRRRSILDLVRVCPDLTTRPAYALWLSLAQLRPVESRWLRMRGGFLPRPLKSFPEREIVAVDFPPRVVINSLFTSVRVPDVEDRFRITLPATGRYRMTLAVSDLQREPVRLVFINGWLHGYLPVDGHASARIDLEVRRVDVEVSLRLGSTGQPSSGGVLVSVQRVSR